MSRRLRAAQRESGFTLLEMMVSLVVLGLLVAGLAHGVRTGFAVWDAQSRQINKTADLDASARILRTLLSEIPIMPPNGGPPQAISITGEPTRLSFVGDLPTGLGATRRAEITLQVSNHRLMLAWRPHLHATLASSQPAANQTELIAGVERLELSYWGAPAPGQQANWQQRWDGPAMPELIRLRLGFSKDDPRHWPDLVAAPHLAPSAG